MDDILSPDDNNVPSTKSVSSDISLENGSDADIKEVDCISVVETCKKEESGFDLVRVSHDELPDATFRTRILNERKETELKGNAKKGIKSDTKAGKPNGAAQSKRGIASIHAVKAQFVRSASHTQASAKEMGGSEENESAELVKSPDRLLCRPLGGSLSRSNFTIPQPFALSTDRRASAGLQRVTAPEAQLELHQSTRPVRTPRGSATKDVWRTVSKSNKGLHEEKTKKEEGNDDVELQKAVDDNLPVSSLTSQGTKAKLASAKANTFSFKCDERAEKRKQFYTKLEERHIAKEFERNQMQAKTKEEMEAEIKELRKSLTFKATPMPAFCKEGAPPPKLELKRIPTTRARSPKLGRRNSIGVHPPSPSSSEPCDAVGSLEKLSVKLSMDNSKNFARNDLSTSGPDNLSNIKSPERNEKECFTQAPVDMSDVNIQISVDSKVREMVGNSVSSSLHFDETAAIAEVSFQGTEKAEEIEACMLETNLDSGCVDALEQTDAGDQDTEGKAQYSQEEVVGNEITAKNNMEAEQLPTNEPASVSTIVGSSRGLHQALKQAVQGIKIGRKDKLKASIPIFRTKKKGTTTNPLAKHSIEDNHGMPQVTSEVKATS